MCLTPKDEPADKRFVRGRRVLLSSFIAFLLHVIYAETAHAYVGPGAGFAFLTSFLVIFTSIAIAILLLLTAPIRLLVKAIRNAGRGRGPYDRVIVLGLDGLDPGLALKMMDNSELPNFLSLKESGTFSPLQTTCPSMSPVAWSSFMTGLSPARHNIFDFLTPDRRTYFPVLSSSEVRPCAHSLRIGGLTLPLGKPVIRLLRKGRPFWSILSDRGIFSCILRVPITFPPERFHGHLLSAMCVPDLKGTQGSFAFYTSAPEREDLYEGGKRIRVAVKDRCVESEIIGPVNPFKSGNEAMRIPFSVTWNENSDNAELHLPGEKVNLKIGSYTDWITLSFKAAPGANVSGICRFYLKRLGPVFELYASPINIDPLKPALPISHPFYYSIYLAKKQGPYATLGLAEDTWALNERVIDEDAFLKQCNLNQEEREKMFFNALKKTRRGVLACVFDAPDRIQHMFWRYHEPCGHQPADDPEKYGNTIRDLYVRMDKLLGRVQKQIRKKDILIVMSDHGFKAFRRCVDLNLWLEKEGYLTRKRDASGEPWLKDVDWTRTKAYALGLSGIYLNIKGREGNGIVEREKADSLRDEIASKLQGLKDSETGETAIIQMYDPHKTMSGPYLDNAPDLIAGYNHGYRVSWNCALGRFGNSVFENNTKSWSGDHCIDPKLVPGILFSNLKSIEKTPSIIDIAPSILSLFNVDIPPNMEGKPIFRMDGK